MDILYFHNLFTFFTFYNICVYTAHFSIKENGSFLSIRNCHFIISHFNVISRLFQKWCSSGVVSAFPLCETIDFTGFSGIFQDVAVADEKYFYHNAKTPLFPVFSRLVAVFIVLNFKHFFLDCHVFSYVFFCKSGKMSGKLFHFTTCLFTRPLHAVTRSSRPQNSHGYKCLR